MRKALLARTLAAAALLLIGVGAPLARATLVYDTTSVGGLHDNPFGPAPLLDDVTFATGPVTITDMNFAYWNSDPSTPEDIDAVVTFWNNMNTGATGATTVNSGLLGSFTRHIGVVAGDATGTTGLFSLPMGITVPDTTVGVQINLVLTGTSTLSDVIPRLADSLPTVGTSADKYWSDDQNPGGSFTGGDAVTPAPATPNVHENFYLRLEGTVPEPSSLAAVLIPGLAWLGSRARLTRGRRR